MTRLLRRVAQPALILSSVLVFVWLTIRADWGALPLGAPLWLCAAMYTVSATMRPLIWLRLLDLISPGVERPQRVAAWRGTSRARATRYVPGRLLNWTTRFLIAKNAGYAPGATGESIAIDAFLPPLALACIGVAAFLGQVYSSVIGIAVVAAGFGGLLWLLTGGRRLFHRNLATVLPSSGRLWSPLRLVVGGSAEIPPRGMAGLLVLYFLWATARTIGFVVLTASMAGLGTDDAGFIALAGAVGGMAGQLAFIAPMGLGVREGVAAGILRERLPLGEAATAVSATRIVQLGAELGAIAATEVACAAWLRIGGVQPPVKSTG